MSLRVLVLFALFTQAALAAASDDRFARANSEYATGNFPEAIKLYEEMVRAGETSAALFYNLGNAQYRAGDSGRAILNYERAQALEPHHPEAQANLRLVRDKARALELRRNAFARVINRATSQEYAITAAISFWLAAFALAGIVFARRRSAVAVSVLAFSLLVCAVALYGLYSTETGSSGRGLAIVTAGKIEARLATADSASTVLALPPGSEVKILSTRGDWVYAALPNNLRGWIPAESAERVRL